MVIENKIAGYDYKNKTFRLLNEYKET